MEDPEKSGESEVEDIDEWGKDLGAEDGQIVNGTPSIDEVPLLKLNDLDSIFIVYDLI